MFKTILLVKKNHFRFNRRRRCHYTFPNRNLLKTNYIKLKLKKNGKKELIFIKILIDVLYTILSTLQQKY